MKSEFFAALLCLVVALTLFAGAVAFDLLVPGECVKTAPFHIDGGIVLQVKGTYCVERAPSLWQRWTN